MMPPSDPATQARPPKPERVPDHASPGLTDQAPAEHSGWLDAASGPGMEACASQLP